MTYMCSLIGFNGVCEADCFGFLGSNMGGFARSWKLTKQTRAKQCVEVYETSPADGTLEWFSAECRKTKTKVITLANHKEHTQYSEPIKTRSNYR